jgi:LysM repeat protein
VPTPREQAGLVEASRLLQEGLQLLDERTREVDALVERAEERAREITADAEQRAQQITEEAEQRRVLLEEQVAALQSEVAAIREEMARLKSAGRGRGTRGEPAPVVVAAPTPVADPVLADPPVEAATSVVSTEPEALEGAEAKQRWGRPSSLAAQAIRRSSRPRWLPRWLPFLVLLLPVGYVLANGGAPAIDPVARDSPQIVLPTAPLLSPTRTLAPTAFAPPTATVAPPTATQPPPTAPTLTNATLTLAGVPSASSPTAALSPTASSTRQPLTVPLSRAPAVPLLTPLPDGEGDGAVVAVYTTYFTYIVRAGDTLNRLATQFGVTGDAIVRASGLRDPNLLLPGQVLTIPRESGWLYRVQANETLDQIAARFGTTADDLRAASMLTSPTVREGELLFIPNRVLPSMK